MLVMFCFQYKDGDLNCSALQLKLSNNEIYLITRPIRATCRVNRQLTVFGKQSVTIIINNFDLLSRYLGRRRGWNYTHTRNVH